MTKSKPSVVDNIKEQIVATRLALKQERQRLRDAEAAAEKAKPKPPESIRVTAENMEDPSTHAFSRPSLTRLSSRFAIRSGYFVAELKRLGNKCVTATQKGDIKILRLSEGKPFPLTKEEKAREGRLRAQWELAINYKKECAKIERKFKVAELESNCERFDDEEMSVVDRLVKARSKNPRDVVTKIDTLRRFDKHALTQYEIVDEIVRDARRQSRASGGAAMTIHDSADAADVPHEIFDLAGLMCVLLAQPDADTAIDGMHRVMTVMTERADALRKHLDP